MYKSGLAVRSFCSVSGSQLLRVGIRKEKMTQQPQPDPTRCHSMISLDLVSPHQFVNYMRFKDDRRGLENCAFERRKKFS